MGNARENMLIYGIMSVGLFCGRALPWDLAGVAAGSTAIVAACWAAYWAWQRRRLRRASTEGGTDAD